MDGLYLMTFSGTSNELRAENRAIRTRVELNYNVRRSHRKTAAAVTDRIDDQ